MEATIHNMIEALGLEVRAIRKQGSSRSIEVRGGERRGMVEGQVLYTFPMTEQVYLRDDSPVRVVAGKDEVNGVVVSLTDDFLRVALERDLGPKIPFARLIFDHSFLIERLKEKFEQILQKEAKFCHEKADQTLGSRPSITTEATVNPAPASAMDPLNKDQIAATTKALGSEVTYLWGPPGTGKTTVVAAIVEGFYRAGLSVLVVSNTNVAVDTALEKIADRLKLDEGFQQGAVIRYGSIVKEELLGKYVDHVDIDRVVDRLGRDLRAEVDALAAKKTIEEAKRDSVGRMIIEREQLEEAKARLSHLTSAVQRLEAKLETTKASFTAATQEVRSLKEKLERARRMSSLRQFLTGLKPQRLIEQIGKAEAKRVSLSDLLSATESESADGRGQLRDAGRTVNDLESRVATIVICLSCGVRNRVPESKRGARPVCGRCRKALPFEKISSSVEQCRRQLEEIEGRIQDLSKRIRELQEQLGAMREEVLRKCKVLATTVYRTYLKGQVDRSFDAVVVDEASMLPLPMVYYAGGLAHKHVVVAGDFRQLPPIVQSDAPEAREWLKQDVFHKSGIATAVETGENPLRLSRLGIQYRMHEEICSVTNSVFYDDRPLVTAPSVLNRTPKPFPMGDSRLLYINTAPEHPWASIRTGDYSRYNILHAIIATQIACHLDGTGYLPPQGSRNEALAIISPYAAQTKLIQRLLGERLARGSRFAATVHRFQGNEKDAIVIDLADSYGGAKPSKFIRARRRDEEGARLLNVAVSRARHSVVLIANFDYLRSKVGAGYIVTRILDHFQNNGEPLDLDELLASASEDWLSALQAIEVPDMHFDPTSAGAFTEGTFYPVFFQDLMDASESVVIFSPFLTGAGATRWMEVLKNKVAHQGLRARLVTRPPGQQGGIFEPRLAELIDEIRKDGIVVDLRASMHEKFAIIDSQILWHGSLNILSHNKTSESMLRIPSRAACEQIGRFATSPRWWKKREKGDNEEVDLASKENPECSKCAQPMLWKRGRYGVYFVCEECGTKIDPRRSRQRAESGRSSKKKARKKEKDKPVIVAGKFCAKCGTPMLRREGRYGPFLGCAAYPKCDYTEKLD